jgi:adenylate cyclase
MDWDAEGLLDGLDEPAREARRALLDDLFESGVPPGELRDAAREDRLALLPVERRLMTGEARYTAREICARTGTDLEYLAASRRALGLPLAGPDDRVYGEQELQAARISRRFRDAGLSDELSIETNRVLGQGLARYAEAMRDLVVQSFLSPDTDERQLARTYEALADELLPLSGPWMQHVFALHMRQVLRGDAVTREQLSTGRAQDAHETAVAFADLVGFTELGEMIPLGELSGVADRLGRLAGDIVDPPARVVKQIGDAVMIVSPDPAGLVDMSLRLVEAAAADADYPTLRVGVAYGPAVSRWGDWFGSPVNLAARLTARARPSSILAAEPVRDAAPDAFDWSFAGEKKLKGFAAPVRAWRARRL